MAQLWVFRPHYFGNPGKLTPTVTRKKELPSPPEPLDTGAFLPWQQMVDEIMITGLEHSQARQECRHGNDDKSDYSQAYFLGMRIGSHCWIADDVNVFRHALLLTAC
ncbi:hypothetical protein SFMTTN_0905 [Sulfuriferula multivorans]|uniref:Uncharacterized protein n=1 Tax=Sulfuriferula multivorans TaxID=1559896 RepID=A0A401JBR6_9PROT|nr:hypothetical protein SFMTTN_0905 [Sulfuriferula multivorans]